MTSPKPDASQQVPSAPTVQPEAATQEGIIAVIPAAGGRQSFRNIRRQLTEEELSASGVQKLLLDELEGAETRCDTLQAYVDRFHESDKRVAMLEERTRTSQASEIMFAVMLAVGSAIIGATPSFWDTSPKGPIALVLGALLVAGAIIARVVKK